MYVPSNLLDFEPYLPVRGSLPVETLRRHFRHLALVLSLSICTIEPLPSVVAMAAHLPEDAIMRSRRARNCRYSSSLSLPPSESAR